MAKVYRVTGIGLAGGEYEATVTDPRNSGSVSLRGTRQFIGLTSESRDEERLQPIRKKEARLGVFNDADVETLTDADEGEIEVSIKRTETGNRVFEGFLFPRRFTHSPLLPHPDAVELVANEGLPLLKSSSTSSFGDLAVSSGNRARVDEVLREILSGLYGTDLPVEVGMNWWPEGGGLQSSDFPLRNVKIDPDNYRERRPSGAEWWDQFEVLADICDAFGLVCRQTFRAGRLCWHLRQPDEIASGGTIPMWEIAKGGGITYLGDVDLSVDIQPKVNDNLVKREHSESFVRARTAVSVTHDHLPVDSFLENPGFERVTAGWDFSQQSSGALVGIEFHSNFSETPDERAGDVRFFSIDGQSSIDNGNPAAVQSTRLVPPEKGAGLRLSWSGYNNASSRLGTTFRLKVGSYFAEMENTTVQSDISKGEVRVPVDPIDGPILEGAVVPIWKGPSFEQVARLTVSRRAEKGDSVIEGDLSANISSGQELYYPTLVSSQSTVQVRKDISANLVKEEANWSSWQKTEVVIPFEAQDGTVPDPKTFELQIGTFSNIKWYLDDLELQPILGGSSLNETVSTASVDNAGATDEITARTGSGPSVENQARLFGRKFYSSTYDIASANAGTDTIVVNGDATGDLSGLFPTFDIFGSSGNDNSYSASSVSYNSSADTTTIEIFFPSLNNSVGDGQIGVGLNDQVNAFFWGIGPTPTTTHPLSELRARQRLRRMRKQPSIWEITPLPIDDPALFHGHEVLNLEGALHTISDFRIRPSEGERAVTIVETTDRGIS
jgi:hypothetical protein